jgi:hypothetical protein
VIIGTLVPLVDVAVNCTSPVVPVMLALLVIAVGATNVAIPMTGVSGKIGAVFAATIIYF